MTTFGHALIALLLVCQMASMEGTQSKVAEEPKWTVTGTLQKTDDSAASGVEIYIFPHKDGKLLHGVALKDGKFGLSNPGAKTDANGRFSIEFTEAYLREQGTEEFVIGMFEWATPAHPTGQPLPLRDMDHAQALPILSASLFKKTRTVNLNDVFKRIIVP